MKPSQMPKDARFSGRINSEVKAVLDSNNISISEIIDLFIDNNILLDQPKIKPKKD